VENKIKTSQKEKETQRRLHPGTRSSRAYRLTKMLRERLKTIEQRQTQKKRTTTKD